MSLSSPSWAACNVEVSPGHYTLKLGLPTGQEISQTIVASRGWQTQVFLMLENGSGDDPSDVSFQPHADLSRASVMMAHSSAGFDPSAEGVRLVEMARLGLAERRTVLGSDIVTMLGEKLENPMMGIYAGHLIVLGANPKLGATSGQIVFSGDDTQKLQILVANIRRLVGQHPDCEALALFIGIPPMVSAFVDPPMLRFSWELIVDGSTQNPALIPRGSLAAAVAPMLLGSGMWLQWRSDQQAKVEATAQLRTAMQSALNPIKTLPPIGDSPFARVNEIRSMASQRTSAAVSVERQLLASQRESISSVMESAQKRVQPDFARLVKAFGVPHSVVEEILKEPPVSPKRKGTNPTKNRRLSISGLNPLEQLELKDQLKNQVYFVPDAGGGVPTAISFEPGSGELVINATNAALTGLSQYLGGIHRHKRLELTATNDQRTLKLTYELDESAPGEVNEMISSLKSFFDLD